MSYALMKGLLSIPADEEIAMLRQLEFEIEQQQIAADRRAFGRVVSAAEEFAEEE